MEDKYMTRRNPFGFGYEVIERGEDKKIKVLFSTPDHAQAKFALGQQQSAGKIDVKPFTNWPPRIVLFKGKHSDDHYIAYTLDDFNAICKYVFEMRDSENWYGDLASYEEEKPTPPDFARESISSLPASMQEDAKRKWALYTDQLSDFREREVHAQMYREAKTGDPDAIRRFIHQSRNDEYSGYEFINPIDYREE